MADNSDQIGQDEIENLLRQAQDTGGATPADSGEPAKEPADEPSAFDQGEIERLMAQGSSGAAAQAVASPTPAATATAQPSAGPSPPPVAESIDRKELW